MQGKREHKVKIDDCKCGGHPYLNEHFTRESGAVLYTLRCHKCGRIVADTNMDDVVYDWNHYICHSETERKLHGCLNMMIESARLMWECGGVEGLEEAAELAYKFYCEMDEALFRRIKENENRKE